MLNWTETNYNVTLSGLFINGRESEITIHKRYAGNYIFSCAELGIKLKLIEAVDFEDLKNQVLETIKNKMISMISDIENNLAIINTENHYISIPTENLMRIPA